MLAEDMDFESSRNSSAWERFVDSYLRSIDYICRVFGFAKKKTQAVDLSHPLVEPNSRLLMRVTVGGLFVVFAIVLCSCQAPRGMMEPVGPSRRPSATAQAVRIPTKQRDESPVYSKQETVIIRKKETGSASGSMWSDSRQPRDLWGEQRPSRVGEVVNVTIPEDLRYVAAGKSDSTKPSTAVAQKGESAAAGGAPAASKTSSSADGASEDTVSDSAGISSAEPIKDLRMEIVAIESTGDVYLRGVREYNGQSGRRMVAVNAKVPRRVLRNHTLDARELTSVTVNEDFDGVQSDYQAPGWDRVVSRKISGYVPDVNSELSSVEDARKDLENARKAFKSQQQAVSEERQRLLKDRARFAQQQADFAAASQESANSEKDSQSAADAKSDKTVKGDKAAGGAKPAATPKADIAKTSEKEDKSAADAKAAKKTAGGRP